MATKSIRFGSIENAHVYDDGDYDSALETDAPIKAGTPVDGNDVLRVDDVGTAAGDVIGPASATDHAAVRFDTTTGKLIQNSGVIINDSNNITGVNDLSVGDDLIVGDNLTVGGEARLNGTVKGPVRAKMYFYAGF